MGQTAPHFRANVNPVISAVLLLLFIISTTAAPAVAGDDNSSDNGHAQLLTVTLQKMDISVSPVDQPFNVTLSIREDSNNSVTIKIPSITQIFNSSGDGPNFTSLQPPTLRFSSFPGQPAVDYFYPLLPPDYPLGGYINTVFNAIPAEFRPVGALPVTFVVGSKITPGLKYMGFIDNQGRLQFSALDEMPLDTGNFATSPTSVTYRIGERPEVDLRNFRISLGPSDAAKSNPADFPLDQQTSLQWDYADWDADTLRGFLNGTYYRAWTDNSAALPYNNKSQQFMSYAVAAIKVKNFGKTFAIEKIDNLSREPGGEDLDPNFTYGEGGVAIDPTNNMNLAADYQQRKKSRVGFILSRSFDEGKTWTKKLLGLPAETDPNNALCGWLNGHMPDPSCQPLDPNLPIGGDDVRVGFDRFPYRAKAGCAT
jgi:hypothetical protein